MADRYDPNSFIWKTFGASRQEHEFAISNKPDIDLVETHSLKHIIVFIDKNLIICLRDDRNSIVVENSIDSFLEHILKMSEIDVGFEVWANIINEYLFYKEVEKELQE